MSLDLNTLKSNMQAIFNAANTTTASRDLSSGMETRVQKVLMLNPQRIPIQASFYPCVTVYIDSKQIKPDSIARNQAQGKRLAELDIKVVGAVWNQNSADVTKDPADNECEALMENIEEILRANDTLTNFATWAFPTAVTYHQIPIDEDTHLRAGLMNVRAKVWY